MAGAQQRVVLYTSNEATLNKLIAAEFEKASGIAVDVISAGSGVVIKRLQSEKDRPQGDLVWGISRSLLQTNKALSAALAAITAAVVGVVANLAVWFGLRVLFREMQAMQELQSSASTT